MAKTNKIGINYMENVFCKTVKPFSRIHHKVHKMGDKMKQKII